MTNYTKKPQLYFSILMLFIACYTIWACKDLGFLGKVFPQGVGIAMLICSSILTYQILFNRKESIVFYDSESSLGTDKELKPFWLPIFWFILPLFMAMIMGFYIAIGLYVFWFLYKIAEVKLSLCIVSSISIWIALGIISHFMVMDFAPGILQAYFELPWPIN